MSELICESSATASEPTDLRPAWLPLLMVLFVGSGCAALIYEIVWLQLLQLVVGSSAISLGVLLGTFMGGMCIGSLLLPRVVSRKRHPLRVYAAMEIGIGVIGIAVLFVMPYATRLYIENVGHGINSILLRGALAAACLLLPTIFMGATLPAIARWVQSTRQGVAWLGLFYAGNIAGAVAGCLLAGFFLLRLFDMHVATYVAAGINFTVALVAIILAAKAQFEPPQTSLASPDADEPAAPGVWTVYVAIALSGVTAMSAEVVWTRLLSLMMGATVYTFSIILAVFLFGLGIGSSLGSLIVRNCATPRVALGICQLLLAAALAWAGYVLGASLPYWPIAIEITLRPSHLFQVDILRAAWVILPAAILWGASFPLALASAVSRPQQDSGRVVGAVYAANTLGAIVGSLLTSMLMIKLAGTQHTQQVLVQVAALSALVVLMQPLISLSRPAAIAALLIIASLGATLAYSIPPVPGLLIAYGRYLPGRKLQEKNGVFEDRKAKVIYAGEGLNSSVAVTQLPDGSRSFHVSGRIEASNMPEDMRVQRMLGHVPALLHPHPRQVLVVGCGAGVTAGALIMHPEVERVVICEIEPLIPQVVAQYFGQANHDVVKDITPQNSVHEINGKRVEVIYDDARHFVATSREHFDIITSDPIHPWIKGSATLYTREYFELCKQHLNSGGIVTQWVPLYESSMEVVKSECATFFEAFPQGAIWSNEAGGRGYDVVFTGTEGPARIDVDALQTRLAAPEQAGVVQSIREVGFNSIIELLGSYAGRGADLRPWLADAQINTDRNLRLQYLAGMAFTTEQGAEIYAAILSHRKFPEDVMFGSEQALAPLRQSLRLTR